MLEKALKGSKNYWTLVAVLAAIAGLGFLVYLNQWNFGLGITGMSRDVSWGFYIAQFTFLVGGTVLIEKIFSYPGIGSMAIDAVINRDLPLIQGIVILFAVLFVGINLAIDLLYALLNPRLRHG